MFSALPSAKQVDSERRRLWLLAGMPWLLPATAIAALFASSLAKAMNWIHDHCLQHLQHHPHFCFEHLPEIALGLAQSLPVAIATLGFLILLAARLIRQAKDHDRVKLLQKLLPNGARLKHFHDSRPLAFALGIRRPAIFLSSGLKQWLTKRQQRLVLAHEAAHIRNRDGLKNALFECLLVAHLHRTNLRQRWHLSTEVLADECVAQQYDALELATILVKLERAKIATTQHLSITGSNTQLRIQHLIQKDERPDSFSFEVLLYGMLFAVPVMAIIHHHVIETVLGWWLP
ncbi:M56 family metallopeptidase [Gilvimarinus sp. SDUM040013]|uniref:M56 family metallopeptidase n=1 Tax=Gilvimarinus gilvus TaxID=3058038 RepID=UPI0026721727|nr:M56 family metallopeptidase [Gilvimarinus sp. SDUM040013]MDO3385308.1 M56 family metallopeptidase [Gilvimarinus sp. SDUM040013]